MSAGERTGRGSYPGVMMALVTDNEDPKGLGRVKVTYPWREAEDESYWARLAAPMAGDDMGECFIPETGDEVLVGFENGDLEHPYVLGGLWNGKQKPPTDNADGNNDIRLVRSRSGHELEFDDADSGGGITIETSAGHVVELSDESGSETVKIEDKSGQNTLSFDPNSGEVSLSAGGTLSIEATKLELKGKGSVSIESSGILTIEGSLVKIN